MKKSDNVTAVIITILAIVVIYIIYKTEIDRLVKKNILNKNTNIPDDEPLLFNEKVKDNHDEFIEETRNLGIDIDVNPNAIMFWEDFESAGTFRSDIQNSIKATGLIQILPSTAIALGTTVDHLKSISNVEYQKIWVRKYFKDVIKQRGKLKDWLDPYLAIFYPVAIGKPDTYALPAGVTPQNPQFDYVVKDGVITVGEIRKYFQDRVKLKVPTMYWKYFGL